MMKNSSINLNDLFKLPWSKHNNPIGWIEATTYCQLACPGCYRGLAFPNPKRIHEDIKKLKADIDKLIEIRNVKVLLIAGGEPLLYPKLDEVISYAVSRELKVCLVTNGAALTEKRLQELEKLGVSEIMVHLAQYQKRTNYTNELQMNKLRDYYCDMFRKNKGINLGFIITLSKRNADQIKTLTNYYQKNSDIIHRTYFTLYRDIFFKKPQEEDTSDYLDPNVLINTIRKSYNIEPCAYLSKTLDQNQPAWVLFAPIFVGEKTIGFADAKTARKLNENSNPKVWNAFPVGANIIQLFRSISYISFPTAKRVVIGYIREALRNPKNILKFPKVQIIVIINTPDMTREGWSICDGCPHAILYEGKLVPSCLLERVKLGEKISLA